MTESTIHLNTSPESTTNETQVQKEPAEPGRIIIWTPTFILTFALILIIVLSLDSLLEIGWLNRAYRGEAVLLVHVGGIFLAFLALMTVARSWWLRIGGLLGCIWTLFMSLSLIVSLRGIDPTSPVLIQLNAAMNSALLGAYICISINRTPPGRLDTWFFSLALLLSMIGVAVTVIFGGLSLDTLGNAVAATTLVLSLLVWCLRPSCWKTHPGPTFLFGIFPCILLILALPGFVILNDNFYLLLVAHLSLFLGILRVIQAERMDWYYESVFTDQSHTAREQTAPSQ